MYAVSCGELWKRYLWHMLSWKEDLSVIPDMSMLLLVVKQSVLYQQQVMVTTSTQTVGSS